MFPWKHVHFIGIGGAGLSAMAVLLHEGGVTVTGSDLQSNHKTELLEANNISIYLGHKPSNITADTELIVISSAVHESNPELIAAKKLDLQIMSRGEFLAALCKTYPQVIAVGGSHGKTTVSTMIAWIFHSCKQSASWMIGGDPNSNSMPFATFSASGPLIIEADESDGTIGQLSAYTGVLVNTDDDHSWNLGGPKALQDIFRKFCTQSKTVFHGNDKLTAATLGDLENTQVLKPTPRIDLPQAGQFMQINASLAIQVALRHGIPEANAIAALSAFPGVERRSQVHFQNDELTLFEDYAHHPRELKALIDAIQEQASNSHKIAIFQVHRYERLESYLNEFAQELKFFDKVFLTLPFSAWSQREDQPCLSQLCNLLGDKAEIFEDNDWEHCAQRVLAQTPIHMPCHISVIGAATVKDIIPHLKAELILHTVLDKIPDMQYLEEPQWNEITTLGAGNQQSACFEPDSIEQLQQLLQLSHQLQLPNLILGCGSNMVGCDKLYEGIIIRLRLGEFAEIKITDEQAYAGAGVKWLRLLKKLNEHSIGGAEALVAVPGSVGGGVRMNAGAQGIETADFIDKIYALTPNGEQVIINNKDIEWNYRSCSLDKNLIITGADMNFKKVEPQNSQEQIQSVRQFRKNTQPGGRNPGCAFRNPGDDSAGRLIDKYGLKEFGIGNCQVSDIHANFLVNNKNASSSEYAELMRQLQTKIYEATGIILQQEVVFSDSTKIQAVKPLHIAVLKGGPSSEREISLESGAAVAKALRGGGHKVTEMDITEESLPTLPENCDLVFPVLHGEFGEDGQVQALIEATGTPYVGCGVESSQLCIDKYASVSALRKAELPVCDSIELTKDQRDMPSDFCTLS